MNRRYPSLAEDELIETTPPKPFSWDRAARAFIIWSIPPLIGFGIYVEYHDPDPSSIAMSVLLMIFLGVNWWNVISNEQMMP